MVAASSVPVRSTNWKLDTYATAHICNDLGKFHELMLSESDDTVKVGGGIPLKVAGRGIVRL